MRKTALITGATSGLGLSYADYFAGKGYDLIITGRREDVIRRNALDLERRHGVSVRVIIGELSNREGVDRLLKAAADCEIDVLVNNAGFGLKPLFTDTGEAEIAQILYLQIQCVVRLAHFVLRGMLERKRGTVINISSDGAFAVMPHNVLYSSAKLFVLNFTEGLHMELAGTGVQVQAVCPGFIDSHFHESAKMAMDKSRKGLFGFRSPDEVVRDAMRDFEKGVVVSVPDRGGRLIRLMGKWMPRRLFYREVPVMAAAASGKKRHVKPVS